MSRALIERRLFDVAQRLRSAREEVKDLLPKYDLVPVAQTPQGRRLRSNLNTFLEITQNLDRYGDEGYEMFRQIDSDLNALTEQLNQEQEVVLRKSASMQNQAARNIRLLTMLALALGLVITVATALEVQRRFREVLQSRHIELSQRM